ncbi:MAG: hypothetical protein E7253_06835 [Lachnospiraceae bacterium]|nr:hypothetical protein [Lachnospiraceae bacterium]
MIQRWKEEEGYFTVEAAFLVPFLFSLVFAVMMTGLFICDLNQAKSFLNQRVVELSLDGEAYGHEELARDRDRLKQQMFITKITDFMITKTDKEVKGSVEVAAQFSIPLIGDWIGGLWKDSFSLCADVGDNVDTIRRWRLIE